MNSRERFLSVVQMDNGYYGNVEIPKVELGYWAGTIRRWFKEGLPEKEPISEKISNGEANIMTTMAI